jgi:hypothetical protein
VAGDGVDLAEKMARHLGDIQAEEVLDLLQRDDHRDAIGEADHDRNRDEADQAAHPKGAHGEQQHAGRRGRDQQAGHSVSFDNAIQQGDKGARGPGNLDP